MSSTAPGGAEQPEQLEQAGPHPAVDAPKPEAARSEARHRPVRRSIDWFSLVLGGIVVLALLLVGGGVASILGFRPFDGSASARAAGGDCPTTTRLKVVATPEIADVVAATAKRTAEKQHCTAYLVDAATGDVVLSRLNDDRSVDVWIPDSSVWLDSLTPTAAERFRAQSTEIARSPVVLALPTTGAHAGEPTPASWATLLNEKGAVKMVDPDHESAGRLVFDVARAGAPETLGLSVAERLIFMSRYAGTSSPDMLETAARTNDLEPFPVSEQALSIWAPAHPGRLKPVIPAAGSPALDYPFVPRADLSSTERTAADALLAALKDPTTRAALRKLGLRGPDGSGGPTIESVAAPAYTDIPPRTTAERKAAIEQWDILRKDMRMLAVVDVSGSMAWPAIGGGGVTRAQVTEDACVTALEIMPAGSKIGGWMFSTGLDGPTVPWRAMANVARLDTTEGATTHRQNLIDMVHTMKSRLQGDTALYDTSLAALKHMTENYEPEYVNSVVLMTDGVNDNPLGGLTLDQLLLEIKKTYDPKRPVRIITIGMGEADSTALQAISAATGGTSYIANTADDIKRVFVEALLARRADVINPTS